MSIDALVKALTIPPGELGPAEFALLDALKPSDGERFLHQVVMRVANPLLLQTMWATIAALVPVAKLEQAMLAALGGDDLVQARNALALPTFVFGLDDAYAPSPSAARLLNRAVQRWVGHPQLGEWASTFHVASPAGDALAQVAQTYNEIGGGARDHAQRLGAPQKKSNTSSRPLATLIDGAQFAQHMASIGTLERALVFLPKLARMPEPMRILTLEGLWGATGPDDFTFIEEQSAPLLGA